MLQRVLVVGQDSHYSPKPVKYVNKLKMLFDKKNINHISITETCIKWKMRNSVKETKT